MTAQGRSIGVIGAGSGGTALARILARKGHRVTIWGREPEVVQDILEQRENRTFLPGVALPETLEATSNLSEAVAGKEILVSVVPAQFVSLVFRDIAGALAPDVQVISASKGIEVSTGRRMDEVLSGLLTPEQARLLTFLSGPSFAAEVSREAPTAVVVASRSSRAALNAQEIFQTEHFRVYTNPDVLGVELGGALKNVIALAAGVIAGMGFGHNTLAALITRGLAEITRLGVAMGADPATFSGLAGMGDLVLTCTGSLSRNRTVGYRIGQGEPLEEILKGMKGVAEGVRTVQAVRELSRAAGVEMPISGEVHALLWEGRDAKEAVRNLMLREPKPEVWS
ncbi:MAG: NAD(P)-dependent glycerol-3-phosphate dehydrogenase [Gemmatimonadales bacterium]|nr:MAG: NAD(P)-dependent glycerol-3-phosphate dehydrogenase [Gemmatimonadales bacterium]